MHSNRRILVVDDNTAIHEDFGKVLAGKKGRAELDELEASLFGTARSAVDESRDGFELTFARQGRDAVKLIEVAAASGRPFAMAFVDIRMPPGWDGVETTSRIWQVDPSVQVVICSAYSDYSWEQMTEKLGTSHQLLILKKPFDAVEALQLAHALTEKWELLRASRRAVADLEAAVEMRTKTLEATNLSLVDQVRRREETEAMLVRAQKLEALGRIAGGIAHEINNPLSVVLSNLRFVDRFVRELESTRPIPADLAEAAGEALFCAERIRRIVRDVKSFARAEAAAITRVDARTVIERAVSLARSEVTGFVKVLIDIRGSGTALGREEALVQVVYNLLSNATAATAGNEDARIEISIDDCREQVAIEVKDNGAGISAENMKRIFEPFFTTKAAGEGTGLGLSICHGIVTSQGGEISVASTEGGGSTFRVTLPRASTLAASEMRGA